MIVLPRSAMLTILISISVGTSGCVRTKLSSSLSPDWTPVELERVLVFFASPDLGIRRGFETRFQAWSYRLPTDFIPSIEILFPGKAYSEEEVRTLLNEHGVDAVLIATEGSSGVTETALPTTATTSCTLWSSSQGCIQAQTQVTGGVARKPWASYTVRLVDAVQMETLWMATGNSRGSAFSDWEDLRNSLVDATIFKLAEDGILR